MRRPASRPHRARAALTFALALLLLALVLAASHCDLAVSLSGLEGGCPPTRGPGQVKITSGGSPFCIDTTEVTNAQYRQFAQSGFTLSGGAIPDGCQGLTGSALSMSPASGTDDFPVVNVNWCQAYEFCAWAGKRLCGQIGGGALDSMLDTNAKQSQWLNACSDGGRLTYPYGNTFSAMACGGMADDTTMPAIVASQPGCVGSVGGLYDMSGNVWEWTDACGNAPAGGTAAMAFCDAMGGAFDSMTSELECVGERNWTRNAGAGNIGFRCCLDL
jgi:sulfatase modifying factor 1